MPTEKASTYLFERDLTNKIIYDLKSLKKYIARGAFHFNCFLDTLDRIFNNHNKITGLAPNIIKLDKSFFNENNILQHVQNTLKFYEYYFED